MSDLFVLRACDQSIRHYCNRCIRPYLVQRARRHAGPPAKFASHGTFPKSPSVPSPYERDQLVSPPLACRSRLISALVRDGFFLSRQAGGNQLYHHEDGAAIEMAQHTKHVKWVSTTIRRARIGSRMACQADERNGKSVRASAQQSRDPGLVRWHRPRPQPNRRCRLTVVETHLWWIPREGTRQRLSPLVPYDRMVPKYSLPL